MIRTTMYADDLINLADEIEEQAKPMLLAAVDGASGMYKDEVVRRLRARKGPAASPAGEAPAEQSGDLWRSVEKMKPRIKGRDAIGGVQTSHPGAPVLEYGGVVLSKGQKSGLSTTYSRNRLKEELRKAGGGGAFTRKARPFMRPAAELVRTWIQEAFA